MTAVERRLVSTAKDTMVSSLLEEKAQSSKPFAASVA
ncbi:hypothetical protein NCHU2750_20560 [Neorhizobium sp. NCHU2750]|nr:hypothetical protein NCHU2750_20560 [Neorhizobium sp. NCHU2750]